VVLGWRPHEFWGATPDEVEGALTALVAPAAPPPDAATIAALKEQFPDG